MTISNTSNKNLTIGLLVVVFSFLLAPVVTFAAVPSARTAMPASPPVVVDLRVNGGNGPISILQNNSVSLSWTSSGATSCRGTWASSASVPKTGNATISIRQNSVFTLTCISTDNRRQASDTVQVTATLPLATVTMVTSPLAKVQTINAGAANQTLGGFDVTVKNEGVTIVSLPLALDLQSKSATGADLSNVSLYDQAGAIRAGPVSATNSQFVFTNISLPMGKTSLILRGTVGAKFGNNDRIQLSLVPSRASVIGAVTRKPITTLSTAHLTLSQIAVRQVAPPAPVVSLQSVTLGTDNNVTVRYGKNFSTCVQLLNESGVILHRNNIFCGSGTDVSVVKPFSDFTALQTGQKVKLCSGNNANLCSALVPVVDGFFGTPLTVSLRVLNDNGIEESAIALALYNSSGSAVALDTFTFPKLAVGDYSTRVKVKLSNDRTESGTARITVSETGYRIFNIDAGHGIEDSEATVSIEDGKVKLTIQDGDSDPETILMGLTQNGVNIPPLSSVGFGPHLTVNLGDYLLSLFTKRGDSGEYSLEDSGTFTVNSDHKSVTMKVVRPPEPSVSISPVPTLENVTASSSNQVIGGFRIANNTDESLVLSGVTASIGVSGAPASHGDITDVVIVDQENKIVAGPVNGTCSSGTCFTDSIVIPKGFNTYSIKATIGSRFTNGQTIRILLTPLERFGARLVGQTSGKTMVLPSSPIELITVTVKAAVVPASKPDIKISSVDCNPREPKINEWISCTVTAYNDSDIAISRSFDVNVQGTTGTILNLPARSSRSVTVPNAFSFSTQGVKELNFPVDIWNTIEESDEDNNVFAKAITVVTAPSITVLSPNGGETIVIDGIYSVSNSGKDLGYSTPGVAYMLTKNGVELGSLVPVVNSSEVPSLHWQTGKYKTSDGAILTASPASDYKIRMYYSDPRVLIDESDSFFTLVDSLPSITVTSPNGGETWQKGTTQTIKWQDNTPRPMIACQPYDTNPSCAPRTYDIRLSSFFYEPPCTVGIPCNRTAMIPREPYTIAEGVYGSSYGWSVGKIMITYGTGDLALPDGSYTVQVCQSGTSICDSSDSYFKITSGSSTNGAPKIVGSSSRTGNVPTGQSVNFSWIATDPDNDDLSWSVDWGDSGGAGACSPVRSQTGARWNYTTSHAWARAGTYQVKATVSDCVGGSDSSTFTVTVVDDGTPNRPPVISGIDAPTTLNVNQQGTWTVKAYDPENGSLNYSVEWGDEIISGSGNSGGGTQPASLYTQTATFTHAYATAGTYTPFFTVKDGGGLIARTSVTVRVEDTKPIPSITSISPTSGPSNTSVTVYGANFTSTGNQINFFCPAISSGGGEANVSSTDGRSLVTRVTSLAVQSGTTISYPLSCTVSITNVNGTSNLLPFTITVPDAQPSITVLSPNGGETYKVGDAVTVSWNASNLPANTAVGLQLSYNLNGTTFEDVLTSYNLPPDLKGGYSWVIPAKYAGSGMSPSQFKMRAILYGPNVPGTNAPQDYSDFPFTITAPSSGGGGGGGSGGSGGSGSGGGGGVPVATITMQPGNDYYFKGPATLQQLTDAGFTATGYGGNRQMQLFTFANNDIPDITDSATNSFYKWDPALRPDGGAGLPSTWTAGWLKVGAGPTVQDTGTLTTTYFIIRKDAYQNTPSTFTIPAGVTYYGSNLYNPTKSQSRPFPSTLTVETGHAYFFKGKVTLAQLQNGFEGTSNKFLRSEEVYTYSSDAFPAPTEAPIHTYFIWNGEWHKYGQDMEKAIDPNTLTSSYFIIAKRSGSPSTLTFPAQLDLTYFGKTDINVPPAPWY